jgi:hypothetical protein
MRFGRIWGRQPPPVETRAFSEKAFRRAPLPAWDAKWEALSARARSHFLDEVKIPSRGQASQAAQPSVPADKFPEDVLKELSGAGFVVLGASRVGGPLDRVFSVEETHDFAMRLRILRRAHLLGTDRPGEFDKFVNECFHLHELASVLSTVLSKVGMQGYIPLSGVLERYVLRHRWPDWIVSMLDDPLARSILEVVEEAGGPIRLADLPGLVKKVKPEAVRAALDKLVAHLALVEDVQPGTWELIVGLLPSVREDLIRARAPRERPPLVVCETPREVGFNGCLIASDLRAFLLEIASEPPRIRQDHGLYTKDVARFLDVLEPLPSWMSELLEWTSEGRIDQALAWAHALRLVRESAEGKQSRLQVSPRGHEWLTRTLEEQDRDAFELLRSLKPLDDLSSPHPPIRFPSFDFYGGSSSGDIRFLGSYVTVIKLSKPFLYPSYGHAKPEDHLAVRESLDRTFSALVPGVFYRLDSFLDHATFGPHNPLLRGLEPEQVAVFWFSQRVPPLKEECQEAGRLMLSAFLRNRLIPLGCLRTAIDREGKLCIARQPRFDAYFGRELPRTAREAEPSTDSRVIVQPDFSVVVIGLNPAPAAELAPFCERTTRGAGQGALVLKLTRESVVKAVAHGLKPEAIVSRLQRHASNELPANVLKEVEGWAGWVRHVTPCTLTVLRCPDQATADRVMSALKRQAERINETLVAIDRKKLTTADRNKLRDQGIIVQGQDDEEKASGPPARRRRYRY